MKLLFDQGTPVPVRDHLTQHTVEIAFEKGWSHLVHGELLAEAEAAGFDAIITTDQNIRYQQNLAGRNIGVVVLKTTNWLRIRSDVELVSLALAGLAVDRYQEVDFP